MRIQESFLSRRLSMITWLFGVLPFTLVTFYGLYIGTRYFLPELYDGFFTRLYLLFNVGTVTLPLHPSLQFLTGEGLAWLSLGIFVSLLFVFSSYPQAERRHRP